MGVIIILFLIAIILAFTMLSFRAWQIETLRVEPQTPKRKLIPEIYFRHLEKIMLHLAKHVIQSILLMVVKAWFIVLTKTKKWVGKNWPKISAFFHKQKNELNQQRNTFVKRAVLESKIKIRRIKEKVKREHS